jgi:hypothetical protein
MILFPRHGFGSKDVVFDDAKSRDLDKHTQKMHDL